MQYINSTVTLKILLVEFSDVRHRTSPSAYTATNYTDALISRDKYVTPAMFSPDSQPVYGSMADWYYKMSNGNLSLTGFVVNNVDANDVPIWVTLDHTKGHYDSLSISNFVGDAEAKAQTQGLDVMGLGDFAKLAIIYAGNVYWGGGLNPAVEQIPDSEYIVSERKGVPRNRDNTTDTFNRIALHCHEFAHTLGIGHSSGYQADIMEAGYRNGPVDGDAPPPFNPGHRAFMGWISPTLISGQDTLDLYYSLVQPTVYRVNSASGNDYFLFENRHFRDSMYIGSTKVPDYSNVYFMPTGGPHGTITQGILVWRYIGGQTSSYDNNGLIYASGRYNMTYPENSPSGGDDGDPFPGVAGINLLSPWSDPRDPFQRNPPPSSPAYNIYVPNTKPSSNVAMEIITNNQSDGYIRAKLYSSGMPNPAMSNQSTTMAATLGNNQRKLYRGASGNALHEVFESGGEIFYRRSTDDGATWDITTQLSSDNRGSTSSPSISGRNLYLYVVWQKATGSKWALVYNYSTDGGSTWLSSPRGYVSNLETPSPGPIPTIQASTPSYSFQLMLAWRDGSQLKAAYTTSPTPGVFNWTITSVTNSGSYAENPSLVFLPNSYPYWGLAWDNGSSIYFERYYYGSWSGLVSFCPPYGSHTLPCLAVNQNNDCHLVWQGLAYTGSPSLYGIFDTKNFNQSVFTVFYDSYSGYNYNFYGPSVTGHTGSRASLLWWYRSGSTGGAIDKVLYDGSNWSSISSLGSGIYVNTSITNPPGGSAWAVWTGTSGPPYSVLKGPSSILSKTSAGDLIANLKYFRRIAITDTSQNATLSVEVAEPEILNGDGSVSLIPFVSVNDSAHYSPSDLVSLLQTQPVTLPYTQSTIRLKRSIWVNTGGQAVPSSLGTAISFEIVATTTGSVLSSQVVPIPQSTSPNRIDEFMQFVVSNTSGAVKVQIRPTTSLSNQAIHAYLFHVYQPDSSSGSSLQKDRQVQLSGPLPTDFHLAQNFPNPFNPSTQIRYNLPSPGLVSLAVFDVLGQKVIDLVNGYVDAGNYTVTWNAKDKTGFLVASGVYFARMVASDALGNVKYSMVNKLLLMK